MFESRLERHIKLCKRNLNTDRVKCCATCPWEDEIAVRYPELITKFQRKRRIHDIPLITDDGERRR